MRRTRNLENSLYRRKYKEIYNLLFNSDLEEINDYSAWFKDNQDYVDRNRPLWIVVESKILNKRIWISQDFGRFGIDTARLDLDVKSNEYHDSYEYKSFRNQKEMTEYLKELLYPCLKEYRQEKINEALEKHQKGKIALEEYIKIVKENSKDSEVIEDKLQYEQKVTINPILHFDHEIIPNAKEDEIYRQIRSYLEEYLKLSDLDTDIINVQIIGSRAKQMSRESSDIDVLVEYNNSEISEDTLFNGLNDDEEPLEIDGIRVDFNPINKERTESMEEWLENNYDYDKYNQNKDEEEKENMNKKNMEISKQSPLFQFKNGDINRGQFDKITDKESPEYKYMNHEINWGEYEKLANHNSADYKYLNNEINFKEYAKLNGIIFKESEEDFYKKLCLACIETENKNLILEENSKIHYLILTDEAKEKTNNGKDITIDNYKNYLDLSFENANDQIYTSWENLFDEHINDQIYYDIKDLGLYDEQGNWNFYIEKEDLKTLGYENLENEETEEEEEDEQ